MPGPASPRLFLVDGYALVYRAFFALGAQPLINSRGENTSIAHGASEFLKRLIAKHKPEYLGWVHDAGLSFRHVRYPEYKATRERLEPDKKADFDTGIERITQILEAYGIPVLSLEGYEADDVIGTLARQAADQQINAVIVSGDKDFAQLVRPGVSILNPWHGRPGFTTEKWYDVQNAGERLGVPAERVVDYLALLGDSSDNIPGVKGIGEKTAHALIGQFGPLESILGHVAEVEPARARNALLQYGDKGILSKELLTIRQDLAMRLDLSTLALKKPDWERLRELFVELEFRVNAQEAASAASVSESARQTGAHESQDAGPGGEQIRQRKYHVVTTLAEMRQAIAVARRAPFLAVATGTVPDPGAPSGATPMRAQLVSIAIAVAPGEAFYLPLGHRSTQEPSQGDLDLASEPPTGDAISATGPTFPPPVNLPPLLSGDMAPLRELIEDPAVRKTMNNGKFDLLVLRKAGVRLEGIDFDEMLASYLVDPGRRAHTTDVLALDLLKEATASYDSLVGKGKAQVPFDMITVERASEHLCANTDAVWRLRSLLEEKLHEAGATRLLHDVELPLSIVLAEMEWRGILIDVPWFHALKARFAKEREVFARRIIEAAGEEFNIDSNKQLANILFGKLGLPVRKKTSTGPSTDASVLQELADEGHALPALVMEYREITKLENTYLDTLPTLVNPATGRLHTSFNQAIASTGRLASSDPNLQNIPIRRQLGKELRKGFIPEPGWMLVTADYSQVELRVLAHLSHDPAFVEAFQAGEDIHRQTAAIIFGVPASDVTAEMRAQAKTINFATIYGQGAHALSRQLKIEHAEARAFIDTYFERFAGVRAFLDSTVERARELGYAETLLGRRRFIPELKDRNFNTRAFGERTAQNSPIQGSAADLIKVAMIRIQAAIAHGHLRARMLLQVHDELVFECPPVETDVLSELVRHEMTTAVTMDVPLVVDIGVGKNWLEAKG